MHTIFKSFSKNRQKSYSKVNDFPEKELVSGIGVIKMIQTLHQFKLQL